MKKNKIIRKEKDRGITLVALVVTIIILIILATISINMAFGDNGLIAKAKETKQHQANAVENDKTELKRIEEEYANMMEKETEIKPPEKPTEPEVPELPEITPTTSAGTEVKKASDWSEKVTAISDGSGNAIPLPNGFYYVGGSRTEGLVISDNIADKNKGTSYKTASTLAGNQYVWIPVDNEETLTRTEFNSTTGQPTTGLYTSFKEPYESGYSDGKGTQEITDFNTMKSKVLKYKGFYIGRYEAGDENAGTILRPKETVSHTVVCKKGVAPYDYVPWGTSISNIDEISGKSGAVYLATNMYNGKEQEESVVSTLCYGSQWDAMCRYIGDAQRKRNTPEKTEPELTGSEWTDMSKNIYDLAGNCFEWTMEAYSTYGYRVIRGGYYYSNDYSVKNRYYSYSPNTCYDTIAFRPALYVKD